MEDSTDDPKPQSLVDRLAVVVTGSLVEKNLGITKIPFETGKAQANATQLLRLWQVTDEFIGMCFDTTSINTSVHKGIYNLLQEELERNLLHFAC